MSEVPAGIAGSRTAAATAIPGAGASRRCANCGATVTARYCGECGQRVEHAIHSLGHFIREAAEDLTHADSRLWRTLLALLVRPGFLTAEFLAGRRARYLPPIRLYLVLSLTFFLLAEATPARLVVVLDEPSGAHVLGPRAASAALQRREDCAQVRIGGPLSRLLDPQQVRAACERMQLDKGRSLHASILHIVPRAMFVFLPLVALVMKLLYWRPRRLYLEHLLFLIHDQAFVFLLFGLCAIVALTPAAAAAAPLYAAAVLYTIGYLYRSMRRVYAQSPLLTTGKLAVLAAAYLVSAGIMLVLTSLYSLAALGQASG